MRLRKAELRGRVKADLALRFTRTGLTSFAGLELVRRYFRQLGLVRSIRRHVGGTAAGHRLRRRRHDHAAADAADRRRAARVPRGVSWRMIRWCARLTGLRRLPVARTIGRWLAQFRTRHLRGLAAAQRGAGRRGHRAAGAQAADHRCRRLGGLDRVDGGVGAARLQSASAQGAELLPDHGLRGAERADAARAESAGQRPRRQGVAGFSAGALRAAGGGLRRHAAAGIPHGRGLFPPRCAGAAGGAAEREYAIKVPFHTWTGLQALVRTQSALDAGGRDGELLRARRWSSRPGSARCAW